jgi:hypothetical protein
MAKIDLAAEAAEVAPAPTAGKNGATAKTPKTTRPKTKAKPAASSEPAAPRRRKTAAATYEERTVRKWVRFDKELHELATRLAAERGYLGLSSVIDELLTEWTKGDE